MKQLIEVPASEGSILVQVTSTEEVVRPVGALDDAIEKTTKSLNEGLDTIIAIARDFQQKVLALPTLHSAEIEFGLALTAKGSIYVVETTGESTLNVKLTFKSGKDKE